MIKSILWKTKFSLFHEKKKIIIMKSFLRSPFIAIDLRSISNWNPLFCLLKTDSIMTARCCTKNSADRRSTWRLECERVWCNELKKKITLSLVRNNFLYKHRWSNSGIVVGYTNTNTKSWRKQWRNKEHKCSDKSMKV